MQTGTFSTGGFYAHKLKLSDSPMRFSAWFNPDGTLADAQAIDRLNRPRPVTAKQCKRLAAMSDLIRLCIDVDTRGRANAA